MFAQANYLTAEFSHETILSPQSLPRRSSMNILTVSKAPLSLTAHGHAAGLGLVLNYQAIHIVDEELQPCATHIVIAKQMAKCTARSRFNYLKVCLCM